MDFAAWLEEEPGRAARVAAHFGRTQSAISQWKTGGVPLLYMRAVQRLTDNRVTLEDMVPPSPAVESADGSQPVQPVRGVLPGGDEQRLGA